mgnify:FL=1
MFGYQTEELIGADVSQLMEAEHAQHHQGYIERYLRTGDAGVMGKGREVIGRRKSGETFLLHLTVSEMMLDGDRTFTAIVHDLSKTISAPAAQPPQQLDHAWLGTVLDSTPAAVTVKDMQGRYLLVNRRAEELLGMSPKQLLGRRDSDIFPDVWAHSEERADAETIRSESPCMFVEPFLRHDEQQQPVSLLMNKNLLKDSAGRGMGIVSIILDVSSLPAMGTSASAPGAELLNALPEPVAFISDNGQVLQANEMYAGRFGMQAESIAGVSIELLESPSLVTAVNKLLRAGARPPQRIRDGDWLLDIRLQKLSNGPVIMIRGSKNEDLVYPDAVQSGQNLRFIRSLSHELRTPLNAVIGFSQLLRPDLSGDDQLESINMIENAGRHLLSLVDQVLDLINVDSGDLPLQKEPLPLKNLVRDCMNLIRPQARVRRIAIHLYCAAETPWVVADPLRCKQILLNLLSNAVKYNREGGEISVYINPIEGRIKTCITDQGEGLSADKLARLFTPFERFSAAGKDIDGNGLGLTISKLLAEQMQGTLTASSVEGEGSTFCLELPQATPQYIVGPDDDVRAEHHKIRSDCRILYIEDNPASARFVERGFKKLHKVEVKVADNGYRGLDMAAREKPEVILLDMELPDIHGMEVLKKLRAIPELARARIYGVSADALSYTGGDIQDAGLDGYLTKPFDLSALGDMIECPQQGGMAG